MRIVIIGEFSSFAKNLSAGFRYLGHECFVFSWGDGFKKIDQVGNSYQVNLGRHQSPKNLFEHILYMIHAMCEFRKLKNYVRYFSKEGRWDVVFILNMGFIKRKNHFWQPFFTKDMIIGLVCSPQNIYLSACGGDIPYFDYWSTRKWKQQELVTRSANSFLSKTQIKHHNYCATFINKVIPVTYSYAEAWRNSQYASGFRVLKTIPLPVDCSHFQTNNILKEKIVVLHGIIRPLDKGSKYITSAMEKLQRKYPNIVECRAEGGMPLVEYLTLLNRANILIDQAYADSVGMNALYGLAMGKIVLGGNEPLNQREYHEYNCPVINIDPDSEQIFKELEALIIDSERINELSIQSREYVERVHDSKVIAQKYINVFMQHNEKELPDYEN